MPVYKSNEIQKDKKTNFVDIFEVVKKKNYSELEEIKASLRVHLKKSKCKVNKLMLEKWIIEIEDLQGIKYWTQYKAYSNVLSFSLTLVRKN